MTYSQMPMRAWAGLTPSTFLGRFMKSKCELDSRMSQGNLSTSGVTTELWVYRTLSLLAEMPMHLRVTGQAGCQVSALVTHT